MKGWIGTGLVLGAAAIPVWFGWRYLMKNFRPANAELAVLQGKQLVRGGKRVFAVTAHPDDLEAAAGGTLRLMALGAAR